MYARAANADEDAQIPARPSWMLVALAVCAALVAFEFDETLEGGAILLSSVLRRIWGPS